MKSADSLYKAFISPMAMKMDVDLGGGVSAQVVIAAGFLVYRYSVVVVEPGWLNPINTRHLAHRVNGILSGDGPWKIGNAKISRIEEKDECWPQWKAWVDRFNEDPTFAGRATRQAAKKYASASLGIPLDILD